MDRRACRTTPRAMPPLHVSGRRDSVGPLSVFSPDTVYSANDLIAAVAGGSVGVLGTLIQLELKQVRGRQRGRNKRGRDRGQGRLAPVPSSCPTRKQTGRGQGAGIARSSSALCFTHSWQTGGGGSRQWAGITRPRFTCLSHNKWGGMGNRNSSSPVYLASLITNGEGAEARGQE